MISKCDGTYIPPEVLLTEFKIPTWFKEPDLLSLFSQVVKQVTVPSFFPVNCIGKSKRIAARNLQKGARKLCHREVFTLVL